MINNNSSASKCHAVEGGRRTTERPKSGQACRMRGEGVGEMPCVETPRSAQSPPRPRRERSIRRGFRRVYTGSRVPVTLSSSIGYRLAKRRTLDKLCLWLRVHVHACISLRFLPFFIRKIESRLVRIRSGTWPRAVISRTSDIDHVNRSA